MLFSRRTEYAIRGLSELATLRRPGGWVMLDELILDQRMPRDFLAKVFQKLVRAGLLRSSKGRGGGFALARAPHEISLMDVLVACEGPQRFDRCVVRFDECSDETPCPQHDLYKPIRQRLRDYLTTTTLADLAASLLDKRASVATKDEQVIGAGEISGEVRAPDSGPPPAKMPAPTPTG